MEFFHYKASTVCMVYIEIKRETEKVYFIYVDIEM